MRNIKGLFEFLNSLYSEFNDQQRYYRCKLVGIDKDSKDQLCANVQVEGMKSNIPVVYPVSELIKNNKILSEFSQIDVRALSFYYFYENYHSAEGSLQKNRYIIASQEILNSQTIYTVYDHIKDGYLRKNAEELYWNTELLKQFSFGDIKNIVSTAVQEQTAKDLG